MKFFLEYLLAADKIAIELEKTVNKRDRTNISEIESIQLLKNHYLLSLFGNKNISNNRWSTAFQIIQKIAEVDTSIAHLLGYHFLVSSQILYRGKNNTQIDLFENMINKQSFFGNSSNPLSNTLYGRRSEDGFIINGYKTFSTGSQVADYLLVSWQDEDDDNVFFNAFIPILRKGIKVMNDWDGFGQKQTGSGTVTFDNVKINPTELLIADKNHISSMLSQCILFNIYTGAAIGALNKAKEYIETNNKKTNDILFRNAGKLYTKVESLKLVVKHTNTLMDDLWNKNYTLTDSERGEFGISILEAISLSTEVSIEVVNKMFEIMGARSATNSLGYDRIWRNIRTLTLHSSLDIKYAHLGKFYLTGIYPEKGYYS